MNLDELEQARPMGTTPPPSASTSVNSPVGYVSQVTPQPQMMSKSPFDVPPTVSARVESASAPIVAMDSRQFRPV